MPGPDILPLREPNDPDDGDPFPDGEHFVSAADLADRWDCSRDHIYRLEPSDLPYMKLGSHRRYRWSDVRDYEQAQTTAGATT
jgi:hypothetical protein